MKRARLGSVVFLTACGLFLMSDIPIGQGTCYHAKLCCIREVGPYCGAFSVYDKDDECPTVANGYACCKSGTNPYKRWDVVNGTNMYDDDDADCDNDITEQLCFLGRANGGQDLGGTVVWYSNGTTACP